MPYCPLSIIVVKWEKVKRVHAQGNGEQEDLAFGGRELLNALELP